MEKIQKTSEHKERDPGKKTKEKYTFELEELEERIAPGKAHRVGTSCFWR